MRKDYQIFAVFALIIVVFIGYWTISGTLGNPNSDANNNGIVLENGQPSNNMPYIIPVQPSSIFSAQGSSLSAVPTTNTLNLTDQLSKSMTSEFLSEMDFKNVTNSKSLVDQINSANSLDVGKLTAQLQQNPLGLVSIVNESDLLISNENSLQAVQSYGQQYSIIFSQAANSLISNPEQARQIFSNAVNNGNYQKLDQLISDFNSGYDKIIKLKTPSTLLLLHKKTLMFLKNSALVFEAIRNGQDDPIKAYVAVTYGATEITSESQEVTFLYNAISKKYNF
jgi:hypothetical protein